MENHTDIQQFSLKDILAVLGQKEQLSGLHINLGDDIFANNAFSYPFRSDNTSITLLLKGKLKIQINLVTYLLEKDDIVLCSPHSIIHIIEVIEPVQSVGITFTKEFGQNNMKTCDIDMLRFFRMKEHPVCKLAPEKRQILFSLLDGMNRTNSEQESTFKKERIYHYFNLLILELVKTHKQGIESTSRKKQIVLDFLGLLEIHAKEERNVRFYAEKLFITADYLSKVSKEVFDMTAHEVIEEVVVMEALDLMKDQSLTIAHVAEKLNFSNQSFFGKFFKNKMKVSPKNFRQQQYG